VPEPEVALLVNARGEIMGYTVGNDMSARDIEGENPLYLPQAKVYEGACALGPGIRLGLPTFLRVRMEILREESRVFYGESSTEEMHRTFQDLISWLFRELSFPKGVYLMTGTGIVPPDEFSLRTGDRIRIWVEDLCLENTVEA
jgi:2-dehydro-3-deoxy-D-arabinonate dehydratase